MENRSHRTRRTQRAPLWCAVLSVVLLLVVVHPARAVEKPTTEDCLVCHGDVSLSHEVNGKQVSLGVDPAKFQESIHGMFTCVDCHDDIATPVHEKMPAKVSCATCHAEAEADYEHSVHAQALQKKSNGAAPTCTACHGNVHEILPSSDPKSRTHHTNIPETCGSCHQVKFVMEQSGLSARPFFSYEESVHGKAVAAGSEKAAVCTDCHEAHKVLPPNTSDSPIFKFNVPATCGKCHESVATEFRQSIHGQAIARGIWSAPVCTDCHGIHLIKAPIDPTSPVSSQMLARSTCAQCHEGVRLSQEFDVPGRRVSSYLDTYHGMASRFGSDVVANCASCHGVHNILPSSDPRSTIYPANLAKTCGRCHPGAGPSFAQAKVHIAAPVSEDPGAVGTKWVRNIYLWLIPAIIGLMLVHNGILWMGKALARRRAERRNIVRMPRQHRIQHWILLVSFTTLALTGFALAYPESWIAWLLGGNEEIRRIAHRISAVVMLGAALYHLGYMLFTPDGRQGLRDYRPVVKDLQDLTQNIRFHLGRSRVKPRFGRFNYADKAEYYALVWGTVLMGTTGLMMWFEVEVSKFLPLWTIDIASALHFYEAVLAVLAIVVWHFYHVMFDPDVYPLNWAFWDGRISEEQLQHHHPLVWEQMQGKEEAGKGGKGRSPGNGKEMEGPPKPHDW